LGAEQHVFDLIKDYLYSILVLRLSKSGLPFRLYNAPEDKDIGAIMTQDTKGKEHAITYLIDGWWILKQGNLY
jgi:hypothetical protein